MARQTTISTGSNAKRIRQTVSPEAYEDGAIADAYRLARKQLRDGTATSPVIVHFLKLGTEKAKLENEKLKRDIELQSAKTEQVQSTKHMEELFAEAMDAFRGYSPTKDEDSDEEEM